MVVTHSVSLQEGINSTEKDGQSEKKKKKNSDS